MVLLWLAVAAAVEPRALLERARELEKQNRGERARYFAREDVKVTREEADGSRRQVSWVTYDAMILEGNLRYRLVARDGKALPEKQQKLQPDGRRSSLDWAQVLTYHELTLVGEEVLDGRRAWRIRTRRKAEAPEPRERSDIALGGSFEIWIDQATGLERKLRFTAERAWAAWRKGATLETWTRLVDRLFVTERALVRNPVGRRVVETDQAYSNYRRFSGESSIRFETP